MVVFRYRGLDQQGQTHNGEFEAKDLLHAKAKMHRRRLRIVTLAREAGKDIRDDEVKTPIWGDIIYRDSSGSIQFKLDQRGPTRRDVIVFSKQFSTMLGSGVPMVQALGVLARQQKSRSFRLTLGRVQASVENGTTLSAAFAMHNKVFERLYVAMVEAGEASGNLDEILLRLVSYMERAEKIKSQIKSALVYPALVMTFALAVLTGLLVFVVPMFAQQYKDNGQNLPELTQFVIDTSQWVLDSYVGILCGMAFSGFALYSLLRTPRGREGFDRLLLKLPIFGNLVLKISVSRFCSTMASMLSSGVNLLEALSICATTAGNRVIEAFVLSVREGLEKGEKFSEPLARGKLFPDMVISMVTVGEETGAIDDMLHKVSAFYEEEVDLAVQTLLSMIEPLMIIGVGGVVGLIVVAMYLPVFEMAGGF